MKKNVKKLLSAVLACCVMLTTISLPVSAASWTQTEAGDIGYHDGYTNLTKNSDDSYTVTYVANASRPTLPSARSTGQWNALKGFHLEFSDISMAGGGNYAMELDFGNNSPENQGQDYDKVGFTILYTSAGQFSVFKNGRSSLTPAQGDTRAINTTIEPLTSAGFGLDIQVVNEKYYQISVANPTNSHTYLFDATDIGLGNYNLLYGKISLTVGDNVGVAKKDSTFKFKYVDNLGFTTTRPNGYGEDRNNSSYKFKMTPDGKPIIRDEANTAHAIWNNVYYTQSLSAITNNGISVKLSDIMAGRTKDYAIAVGFSLKNGDEATAGNGYDWYVSNHNPTLMFVYKPDTGTWGIAHKNGYSAPDQAASWESYAAGTMTTGIVNAFELNLKRTAANAYKLIVNGQEVSINDTDTLYGGANVYVGFGVLQSSLITIDTEQGTVSGLNNYRHNNTEFMSGSDYVQFTIDELYDTPAVESVALNVDSKELNINDTFQLSATILPAGSNQTVTYESNNPSVATVDANTGLVTAIAEGTATITVTTAEGGFTDTCEISVVNLVTGTPTGYKQSASGSPANNWKYVVKDDGGLTLRRTSSGYTLASIGTDTKLSAETESGILVSLSDIISSNDSKYTLAIGFVGNGSYAWYNGNGVAPLLFLYQPDGTYALVRKEAVYAGDTTVYQDAKFHVLAQGKMDEESLGAIDLSVKVTAAGCTVDWGTGNYTLTDIGQLNNYKSFYVGFGVLGGITIGEGTVTGFSNTWNNIGSGGLSLITGDNYVQFTVDQLRNTYPATGVALDKNIKYLYATETYEMGATVLPVGAVQSVTYVSNNPEIATIDPTTGLITAVAEGTATITVTSEEGGYTDECTVVVLPDRTHLSPFTNVDNAAFYYQSNDEVVRFLQPGTAAEGKRFVFHRNVISKKFNLTSQALNLDFVDITSTTGNYSIAVSIGASDSQWYDQAGYMLLVSQNGYYAVVKTRGGDDYVNDVADESNVVASGTLSEELRNELSLSLFYDNATSQFLLKINNAEVTFEDVVGLNHANMRVAIGTMNRISKVTELAMSSAIGADVVSYVMSKNQLFASKIATIKELRAEAPFIAFMMGVSEELFEPGAMLTRADAIVAMAKFLADENTIADVNISSAYSDLDSSANYYQYVLFMEKNEYLPSTFAGSQLNPSSAITRAELVDLLLNVGDTATTEVVINDVANTDTLYDKISYAVEKNILLLDSDGNFNPNGTITRGDAATVLCTFVGKTVPTNFVPTVVFADTLTGDVIASGTVDAADLVRLKKHTEPNTELAYLKAADIDNNKIIDVTDVVLFRELILGNANAEVMSYEVNIQLATNDTVATVNNQEVQDVPTLSTAMSTAASVEENVMEIELGDGVYNLSEPLTISATDTKGKKVVIKNAEGTTPVLSGNKDIAGSLFTQVSGKSYYSYQLPDSAKVDGSWPQFRDLYVNGERLKLAKSTEYKFTKDIAKDGSTLLNKFYVNSSLASKVSSGTMPEMSINIEWTNRIYPVASFGSTSSGVTELSINNQIWNAYLQNDGNKTSFIGKTYWFQNHLALLDEAGEFYYDGVNGIIYVYPTTDTNMNVATVSYPSLEKLIVLEGTTDVTIEGIKFTGTTSNFASDHGFNGQLGGVHAENRDSSTIEAAAIYSENSSRLTIQNCVFDELGGNAIFLNGKNRNIKIRNNTITNVAMSAVVFGKQTTTWVDEYEQSHINITNNKIQTIATDYLGSPAVAVPRVRYLTITHNTITDTSYSGIMVGWITSAGASINVLNSEIAYNYLDMNMTALNDGGAIYMGGANSTHSDDELFNSIHDNYINAGDGQSTKIYDGIYLDMNTSNVEVYSNVLRGFKEVSGHHPVFLQDVVRAQFSRNITVRDNYTSADEIPTRYTGDATDGSYELRNIVVSNNTYKYFSSYLDNISEVQSIKTAAGVK